MLAATGDGALMCPRHHRTAGEPVGSMEDDQPGRVRRHCGPGLLYPTRSAGNHPGQGWRDEITED